MAARMTMLCPKPARMLLELNCPAIIPENVARMIPIRNLL
jgi:hypothetical protein